MKRLLLSLMCATGFASQSLAQSVPASDYVPSICQVVAANNSGVAGWPGLYTLSKASNPSIKINTQKLDTYEVSITYVTHSTFRIETAGGVTIATDFAGFAGNNVIPDVVTMNHAHTTHWTAVPDPRIKHVLRGWAKDDKPAEHRLQIADALIRNVTTNIDNNWVGFERDGNSIFIFEIAGLCIGHLGHLHHLPTDNHYAQIGRLDIVMVPVDGGLTLTSDKMSEVAKRLRSSVVLPMHWFGRATLGQFISDVSGSFAVDNRNKSQITVSLRTLPQQPTLVVLQPELQSAPFDLD